MTLAQEEYSEDCVSSEFVSTASTRRTVDTTTRTGLPNHCVIIEPKWFQIPQTLLYIIPLLKNLWSTLWRIWTEDFHHVVFHFFSSSSVCLNACMITCSSLACTLYACSMFLWWISLILISISSLWSSSNSSKFDEFLKIFHSASSGSKPALLASS